MPVASLKNVSIIYERCLSEGLNREMYNVRESHDALLRLERCNAQIRNQDVHGVELTGDAKHTVPFLRLGCCNAYSRRRESHGTVLRLGRCNAQKRTWAMMSLRGGTHHIVLFAVAALAA